MQFQLLFIMKSHIYMILAAICLGTIGVLVKLIGNNVHFMTLNFYRVFFGFIFLLITVPLIDKNVFHISKKDVKDYFFIGAVFAIALSLYTTANLFAPIQNVVLINYIYPFFVLGFAYFLLKERITKTKIITLIIAVTGLAIINPFQFGSYSLGNFLSFVGAFFYAILITEMRKEDKTHTIGDVFWFLLFGSLILLPFPFIFGFGNITAIFVYVVLLGVVSTGLAYLMYNMALEHMEAETCSIIATIITPIISIILAVFIISEYVDWRIIIGGVLLIMAGIYLETHNKKLKKEK